MASPKDKCVDLSIMIGSMVDAMSLLSRIAENGGASKDDLVQCELMTSQFKKDFSEELLTK